MSDQMQYDEDRAVKYIRQLLPTEKRDRYSDDEILYVIDIMYDWYDKNGYLDINASDDDEEEIDLDKLTAYVKKEVARDKELEMDPEDVVLIVKGELEYEDTLEDFI